MEKFWRIIEKNKFYRKVYENKFFGKLLNRETISYIFFGVLTTIVSIGAYAAALWLFEKNGWFAGNSPGLTEMMAKRSWLRHVPNLSESLKVLVANAISWVFAVVFAFVTNKLFVFASKSWKPGIAVKEAVGFVSTRMFSLVAETMVIVLFVSVLSTNEFAAKIAGQILVTILNYILSKLFVFKKS